MTDYARNGSQEFLGAEALAEALQAQEAAASSEPAPVVGGTPASADAIADLVVIAAVVRGIPRPAVRPEFRQRVDEALAALEAARRSPAPAPSPVADAAATGSPDAKTHRWLAALILLALATAWLLGLVTTSGHRQDATTTQADPASASAADEREKSLAATAAGASGPSATVVLRSAAPAASGTPDRPSLLASKPGYPLSATPIRAQGGLATGRSGRDGLVMPGPSRIPSATVVSGAGEVGAGGKIVPTSPRRRRPGQGTPVPTANATGTPADQGGQPAPTLTPSANPPTGTAGTASPPPQATSPVAVGNITGTVRRGTQASAVPLSGVTIWLVPETALDCTALPASQAFAITVADAGGRYGFGQVPLGRYHLATGDGSECLPVRWHRGASEPGAGCAESLAVAVEATDEVTTVNVLYPPEAAGACPTALPVATP